MKFRANNTVVVALAVFFALLSLGAKNAEHSEFEEINPSYFETDVRKLIQIKRIEDITKKRDALIQYIWQGKGYPSSKLPDKVEERIEDDRYATLFESDLKQINKITVRMEHGLESIAYHFIPKKCCNKLIVYHQGHRGDFIKGMDTIGACLQKGYSVMAFSMPLLGMNNKPTVYLEYFVEPVTVALNYAEKFNYDAVHMLGISGGGWTTTIYAAIDTRIMQSFPVAGSYPIYLRSQSQRDWGDFEQTLPDLYRIANYPELYVMASCGDGRKQIQMLNQYDSCCFAGIKFRTYEKVVKNAAADLGKGEFRVFLDQSHKDHKISEKALSVIFAEIEGRK
ncbi:MAG: alpha/beta fold hydrolase [Planctomycetota bacterium]|jgi:hypothetical protein